MPIDYLASTLPENMEDIDYEMMTELSMYNQNLTEIPKFLLKCINLKHLSLNSNKISKIENLQNCKRLRELNLTDNNLTSLDGLESLQRLRYLDVDTNLIPKEVIESSKQYYPNIRVYA